MHWKPFFIGTLCGVISLISLFSGTAHAQAGATISINPATVYRTVQAGSVTTGTLLVANVGQSVFNYQAYVTPYSVANYAYSPIFVAVPGRPDASKWIQFTSNQATIIPNRSIDLDYTITVPPKVPPGGYYAVGFAETELPAAGSGIKVKERVGCVFYLQVAGNAKESGKIQNWKTSFLQSSPPRSSLQLVNTGSTDYISTISVNLHDIIGTTKASYSTQKIVLPQTIRQVNVQWPKVSLITVLRVNGRATVFGKSTALPTKYILVISRTAWLILFIVFIVLIAQVVLRYILRHKMRK